MPTTAREVANRLSNLLRSEHEALADFVAALSDFDQRRLWVDLGYPSLFAFLQRELRLSDGAAFYRQTAARLSQRFPEIIEALRVGTLCLTTTAELSKVITDENAPELLPRFSGLSKREAKEVVAELSPAPSPERTVISAIPVPPPRNDLAALGQPSTSVPTSPPTTREVHQVPAPATLVEPKTAALSRMHVTVSRSVVEKLAAARDALSHSNPGASDSEILEVALDLVLERAARRRALVKNPRKEPSPSAPDSDHVPAHVAREVWTRDDGRCQWPVDGGGVCGSTHQVQLDHIVSRALGGPATVANLRCACRFHNDLHARETFGDDRMDEFTSNPRGSRVRETTFEYPSPNYPC
jgi:hypothetical protein